MLTKGVIVGCDQNQEWLLPWWWEHYTAHNHFPVAFADFGMTQEALNWCRARGECLSTPGREISHCQQIPSKKRRFWEQLYGEEIWDCRPAWFKKPLALIQSPFSLGIWIDLDCQVNCSLDPLFNSLAFGAEIGLVREPDFVQLFHEKTNRLLPGEIYYNSGVIVFRQGADILHRFAEEAFENNDNHPGDQGALCRAVFTHCPPLVELPLLYNWVAALGLNPGALIFHHTGISAKEWIKKSLQEKA